VKPKKEEPAACCEDTEPAPPPRKLKAQASAPYGPGINVAARQTAARSAADLADALGLPGRGKEVEARVGKVLKVPQIDWKKQMVVLVTAGRKNSGGYKVELTDLSTKDRVLTVRWKLESPKGRATRAITHPGLAVLTERFDG